jgi:ribose-phosphate pyrophosphokinase
MIFLGDVQNKELSESVGEGMGIEVLYPQITVFQDGERRVYVPFSVLDKKVLLLKSCANPPDSNFLELLFLIDALKRSGAVEIVAVVPYLCYSRADHIFREGEGVPLEVIAKALSRSGIEKLFIVDPHSIKIPEVFEIPCTALSALPIFADKIKDILARVGSEKSFSLVSPDMGGIRRVRILSRMVSDMPIAVIEKERDLDTGKVKATRIAEGKVGETVFIVDDIISSGQTIAEAVYFLREKGAKSVYVFATHAILSGQAKDLLEKLPVEKIFVTNSVAVSKEKIFNKLEILDVGKMIAREARKALEW